LGLIVAVSCIMAFNYYTQVITYIKLRDEPLKITPKEFYISAVEDARIAKNTIGAVLGATNAPGKALQSFLIDIEGGAGAIENFMISTIDADKGKRPVIVKLNSLNVTEVPAGNSMVKGEIKLNTSFYLAKGDYPIHLVDYNANTTYQRKAGPAQQIEPLIRSTLNNCAVYLNKWMNEQAGANIKLAKAFKINFTNYTEPVEGDTIYYNPKRPLTWNDFKGSKPGINHHDAGIFAGLGYEEEKTIENGVIYLTFGMKVYAPKSACWVSPNALTAYNLNHEQRHFDIAKLVAEHYKQAIIAQNPTPDTYDAIISMGYLDALREMNKLQKQYDNETAHSINSYQQQLWDSRIDKELAELKIKGKMI